MSDPKIKTFDLGAVTPSDPVKNLDWSKTVADLWQVAQRDARYAGVKIMNICQRCGQKHDVTESEGVPKLICPPCDKAIWG